MSEAVRAYGDDDVVAWMRSLVRPYGTALLCVGLAAAATWLLWERLYPSLLPPFLAAVTVAAWVGGLRSGLAATALAIACAAWFTMTRGDVRELGLPQVLWTGSFVLVAIL